jgi:aldose sugar dehydrogenase
LLLHYAYLVLFLSIFFLLQPNLAHATNVKASIDGDGKIIIRDPTLKVEEIAVGLVRPTTMAFLGQNDILVLEKNNGTVQRVVNGNMQHKPIIDIDNTSGNDVCTCGISVSKSDHGSTYVFLHYYNDYCAENKENCLRGQDSDIKMGNKIYRYELVNNTLVHSKVILNLPSNGVRHNGGIVITGPDNNLYLSTGDLNLANKAKNQNYGPAPDGSSGILRITQHGQPVNNSILDDTYPLNLYYAYGIRNSFGMDFDPLTKKLWDTENGPKYGDEINLVEAGFNSGWKEVQGLWKPDQDGNFVQTSTLNPDKLINFNGKGKYSTPEFIWNNTIGPTALKFLNSDKLGKDYENDMFIGDVHHGRVYHFDLNESRTGLSLEGVLADKLANTDEENKEIIFAEGFKGVTDIEVGLDGFMYVVSIGQGSIFRIVPLDTPVKT